MPTREEMLAALKGPNRQPSREDMLSTLKGTEEDQGPGLGMKALDYTGRALDYAGGLTRTGLAQMADTFTEKNNIGTQDFLNALKGKAPSSEEIMGRFDIPEGASVDVPFIGDVSARDVGGFALDVAADPLTYVSLGMGPLAKSALRGGVNIAKRPLAKAGTKIYKSGFKKIDEALKAKGKTRMFSDIMLEKGITGTNKKIQKKSVELADGLMKKRDNIFKNVDSLGAKVDLSKVADEVIDSTSKLRTNPLMKETADKLDNMSMRLMERGKVSVSDASQIKTDLYDALPASAFNSFGQIKKPVQKYTKKLANSLKNAIEKGAEKASKGAGNQVKKINTDLGSILTGAKPLEREVAKGVTKNAITSIDAMAVGAGMPWMAAAKKAGDLSKTTILRTKIGKGLKDFGESGIADTLLRNTIIDRQQPTQSPWARMRK